MKTTQQKMELRKRATKTIRFGIRLSEKGRELIIPELAQEQVEKFKRDFWESLERFGMTADIGESWNVIQPGDRIEGVTLSWVVFDKKKAA